MNMKTNLQRIAVVLAVCTSIFALGCGGVDSRSVPETGDDILSIGKLYVEYYADLQAETDSKPLDVVINPDTENEEVVTRVEAPKAKVPGTLDDEVVFVPDNPDYVYDSEGNKVAISDLDGYDWNKNPDNYSGFNVTAKFEMPEFTTILEYNGTPTLSSVPAPKEKESAATGKTTSYPFVIWKTLTGSVAPEPNEALDVVNDARLARGMVKVSDEGVFPPEYLLKVYAIYQDSFSIDEQLKIAAQKQREAEAKLKAATAIRYDDEKLVGKLTDKSADESAEDYALVEQLRSAYDSLNDAMKGTTRTVEADLGDGKTKETITVIEYNNDDIVYYSNLITELTEDLASRGAISTQVIPTQLTLTVDKEYGAIYGIDADGNQIITNSAEVTTKRAYSVTVVTNGTYEIDLYGASGGHMWTSSNYTSLGGAGAHVKALVELKAGNVLRFYIGGEGEKSASYDAASNEFSKIPGVNLSTAKSGGWNGGGSGGSGYAGTTGGSGGGGATDVRIVLNVDVPAELVSVTDVVSDTNVYTFFRNAIKNGSEIDPAISATSLDTRILVAGGGGGANQDAGTWMAVKGQNGGSTDGLNGLLQVQAYYQCFVTMGEALAGYPTGLDLADANKYAWYSYGATGAGTEEYTGTKGVSVSGKTPPSGTWPQVPDNGNGHISPLTLWKGGNGRNGFSDNGDGVSGKDGTWAGSAGGGGGYYGGRALVRGYPTSSASTGNGANKTTSGIHTPYNYYNAGSGSGGTNNPDNAAGVGDVVVTPVTTEGGAAVDPLNQVFGDGYATIRFVE